MSSLSSIIKGFCFAGFFCTLVVAQEPGEDGDSPTALIAEATSINPDPKVHWKHQIDPDIWLPPDEGTWPEVLQDLWIKALRYQESDLRREAADTVALAHSQGMPIGPSVIEALQAIVEDTNEKPLTVTAAAAALVSIDAKESAEILAQRAETAPQVMRMQLDKAFARWDYQPMRTAWLARLENPAYQRSLVESAVVCLGEVGEPKAISPLLPWLTSPTTTPSLRIKVARALAKIPFASGSTENHVELALRLLEDETQDARLTPLLAALLVAQQDSPEAIELLVQITQVQDPSAIAEALRQLLVIAPERIIAQAESFLRHGDANIRYLTVASLENAPIPQSVIRLAGMLGDPVPKIRSLARRTLLVMAAEENLRSEVIRQAEMVIATDDWRGVEQSILILTELNQEQIGTRLLELTDHPRSEVYNTACWGLRRLKIQSLGAAIHERYQQLLEELQQPSEPVRYDALGHLAEALAELNYQAAIPDLVKLIPKEAPIHPTARSAAIWALGHLLAGTSDTKVARALESRLADASSVPPESFEVRAMSAVSLGRIGNEDSLAPLRQWAATEGADNPVGRRCYWSIREMTGEPLPDIQPRTRQLGDWFLQAVSDQ